MDTNSKLAERLNKYFNGDIKLTFVSQSEFVIITKDDKLYKFKNQEKLIVFLALSEDNSIIDSMIVKELCDKGIVDFSCGERHVFAWDEKQNIYCWGLNGSGQLGNGRRDIYPNDDKYGLDFNEPELNEHLSGKNIVNIKSGFEHSFALTRTGEVYAWGWNRQGQIGCVTSDKYQLTPIKVDGFDGEKIKGISCGSYYSMALTESGRVFSWGDSDGGN